MKLTTTTIFATAALLAAAATGNAQTMKAEIPFAFETSNARMQPGSYQVVLKYGQSGSPTLQIFNADSKRSIFALPQSIDRPSHTAANGSDVVLSFECTEGHCVLARLWDGSTTRYSFATPKPGASTHVATVILRHDRGD